MRRVVFRLDAGPSIGLGHLQRCLSLASALAAHGAGSYFVMRGNRAAHGRITRCGFAVTEIPPDCSLERDLSVTLSCLESHAAQVVVVDSREVNCDYLYRLRGAGHFVVSIDDLAELMFPSNLVVNGNIYAQELSYRSATGDTRFLLGTEYVMLQPEFWGVPRRLVDDSVFRILLTLGGIDQHNLMPRLIGLLDDVRGDFSVTALIGPFFDNGREVEEASRQSQRAVRLIYEPESVRDIMLEADLVISGGGQTLYQLARLGCPTVALQVAPDQQQHLRALAEAGVVNLGGCNGDDLTEVRGAVLSLFADCEARAVMSAAGRRLVDGKGAHRVARTILEEVGRVRDRHMLR